MQQDPPPPAGAVAATVAALSAEVQGSAASELRRRIAFVVETARRLHQYGTAAPRLESAIDQLAARVGLRAQVWSSPTALIVSFADGSAEGASLAEITQVMRLSPGDLDLRHLVEVNEIADARCACERPSRCPYWGLPTVTQ